MLPLWSTATQGREDSHVAARVDIVRRFLFGMLLLLAPLVLLANEKDVNNCHDPSAWSDWEARTAKHLEDMELQTLHALWMGLCVKGEQGAIAFEQAMVIFERVRGALIQQRREQRQEQQQHNLL